MSMGGDILRKWADAHDNVLRERDQLLGQVKDLQDRLVMITTPVMAVNFATVSDDVILRSFQRLVQEYGKISYVNQPADKIYRSAREHDFAKGEWKP